MDPWSHEARVERAKVEVDTAYRLLAPYFNLTFMGTPTKEDLRQLLKDAYGKRAALNEAIACAEMHFPETNS